MPIENINQPEIIEINSGLRLKKFDGKFEFALPWYQDEETLLLVDGCPKPYDGNKLEKMYTYLNSQGELYFIEIETEGIYRPIGDVTFWKEDMPIVIGERRFRGMGIGRKVVDSLVFRGRQMGYEYLLVNEIYHFNAASQQLFESAGFSKYESTSNGFRYRMDF